MQFRDQDFTGQDVALDGNTFTGCTFRDCRMIFRAESPVTLGANHFKENVKWVFDGPAMLTIDFLRGLYHGLGEGGRKLIEQTFQDIRRPLGGHGDTTGNNTPGH